MGCVNLLPFDIKESMFETNGVPFNPSKLDTGFDEKKVITEAVVKMLKKNCRHFKFIFVRNTDSLLSKKSDNIKVEWVGKLKIRLASEKYKVSY